MANIYFDLTREFNREGPIAILASGQAVVYHRLAIMSKDGDWILRETVEACSRILAILGRRKASYRPGAPLDLRWLSGGWSSHFEFRDDRNRRIRCDFFSRPPRLPLEHVESLFANAPAGEGLLVLDIAPLIRLKQTQRAKDHAVIGELARRLPPEEEIETTTDPDRILELAPDYGTRSTRPSVLAALAGAGRESVVVELAREIDRLQLEDRARIDAYRRASLDYIEAFRRLDLKGLPLEQAHRRVCDLAGSVLPSTVPEAWRWNS